MKGDYKYDSEIENDAFKFLGAYIGPLTGLHAAILLEQESIALDIVDATLNPEDLDMTYGSNHNTALHLASLLGSKKVVAALLGRCASANIKNRLGFSPIDVCDDPEMSNIFQAENK